MISYIIEIQKYLIISLIIVIWTIFCLNAKKKLSKDMVIYGLILSITTIGMLIILLQYIKDPKPEFYGPIFILIGSIFVFSLKIFIEQYNKEKDKENLLKSILNSSKDRFKYDYDFLNNYKNAEDENINYGDKPFKIILNENLFNHLIKQGFERKIMHYIELVYGHSKNMSRYIEKISINYEELYEKKKFEKIIEYNQYIHASCIYYYVYLFILDEKFNYGSDDLVNLCKLIDNKTRKKCLEIAKKNEILEKLRKYNEKHK
ncbi:hypothetical protein SDC9_40588 [bioreactor metagenome]|uniref:Uncharacterized protein n=1 Tax=bioreactor metagenome TaxID=1076179 RepID=A0A644VSP7_9ZZZZ|nr:hypothetical protein [Methanobrevibacter sp.]MEA4957122.1 hypothetical protein [Methanobrevibacter sp.]